MPDPVLTPAPVITATFRCRDSQAASRSAPATSPERSKTAAFTVSIPRQHACADFTTRDTKHAWRAIQTQRRLRDRLGIRGRTNAHNATRYTNTTIYAIANTQSGSGQ